MATKMGRWNTHTQKPSGQSLVATFGQLERYPSISDDECGVVLPDRVRRVLLGV